MGTVLLKNISAEGVASNILIEGSHIAKVVPADVEVAVPEGSEVMDCTGKAVLPGLVNISAGQAEDDGQNSDSNEIFHRF